jgi:SAM-dependent methyltransferase
MGERDHELADLDPAGRFSDRAEDYRRHRPTYPAAAFDAILAGLGSATDLVGADVGAGTGIASRLLAARGVQVIAIEPNAEMRAAAEPAAGIRWGSGTAEATGLPGAAVQLVLCAQSFHWFREEPALAEFQRILAPGGRLAVLWNNRDGSDPLTAGYIEAIHRVNGEHPAEMRPFDSAILERSGRFTAATVQEFPNAQRLDRAGLLGRATSASYVPKEGAAFERLRELLEALWERHRDAAGEVTLRYRTKVVLAGRLPPREPGDSDVEVGVAPIAT